MDRRRRANHDQVSGRLLSGVYLVSGYMGNKMTLSFTTLYAMVIWFLTFLFVGLKWFGAIDWNWLWVLSPLWISGLFGLFIGTLGLALLGVSALIEYYIDRAR